MPLEIGEREQLTTQLNRFLTMDIENAREFKPDIPRFLYRLTELATEDSQLVLSLLQQRNAKADDQTIGHAIAHYQRDPKIRQDYVKLLNELMANEPEGTFTVLQQDQGHCSMIERLFSPLAHPCETDLEVGKAYLAFLCQLMVNYPLKVLKVLKQDDLRDLRVLKLTALRDVPGLKNSDNQALLVAYDVLYLNTVLTLFNRSIDPDALGPSNRADDKAMACLSALPGTRDTLIVLKNCLDNNTAIHQDNKIVQCIKNKVTELEAKLASPQPVIAVDKAMAAINKHSAITSADEVALGKPTTHTIEV